MSNSALEAVQLVRRKLLSNVELTNTVSGRVYTSHFLDVENQTVPMPLVILDNQGGDANYGKGVQRLILHIYVYSKLSSTQADQIYHTVYETLQACRLSDDTANADITAKGMIYEQERPRSGFNEAVKGWFKRATYVIYTSG